MKNKILSAAVALLLPMVAGSAFAQKKNVADADVFRPGELWLDNRGQHINAHGGGLLRHDGKYYWFGEHKSENTSAALVGVTCYSSKNLTRWNYEGVALSVVDEEGNDIERGCIIERPKVIYNEKTGKFVMWFHLELKGKGYAAARYGVAVSDTPVGPYKFLYSSRANAGIYPIGFCTENTASLKESLSGEMKWWTPLWRKEINRGMFIVRDFEEGQMSRDMTLYVDDDGKAYHIYSSEENLTLHIAQLTDDFLHHNGTYVRVAPGGQNEAPAIFKHDGTYWMITSGCTGWAPNKARMFSAKNIFGPWKQHPSPCRGPLEEKTFGGQSTYIQKFAGKDDCFIFMADIWRPKHPIDARYIWLPITFENAVPVVEWKEQWTIKEAFGK